MLDVFESVGGIDDLNNGEHIDSGMNEKFQLPIDPKQTQKPLNFITKFVGQARN